MEFRILNKSGLQRKVDKTEQFLSESTGYIANELDSLNDDILAFETDINEFLSGLDWKEAVDTYDDIATTYPNPEDGWTVSVKDTNYVYRYNGTEWVPINVNAIPDATEQNKGLMTTTQASKLYDLHDYVLPIATGTELGGLKTDNDTLVTDANGVALAKGLTKNMPDLRDTVIGNLVGGQVLTYDEEHRVWKNAARGGIDVELDDVSGASISSDSAQRKVFLTWTDPSDVVISGVTLAEWDGTKVVRKEGSAPNDINDGVLITDSKIRDQYSSVSLTDSSVSFGIMYYYRFFPYSKKSRVTNGTVLSVRLQEESVEIPTVVGTYMYNGNQQTVVLSSNTGFTLSGNVSAINAGTYTAYATLDIGYIWSDGTYEVKEIQWTIAKANSDIIATPNSILLDLTHLTNTTTLSNLLGRSITSITVADETIATASISIATITVSHVNQASGSTSMTIVADESQNYNASTITVSIDANFASTILNDNSWETINAAAIDGTASSLWNVGDRKIVELNSNTIDGYGFEGTYCVFIIGFNHNSAYTGGHDIHFQFCSTLTGDILPIGYTIQYNTQVKNSSMNTPYMYFCMNTMKYFNSSGNFVWTINSNGGWRECQLRKNIIPQFRDLLPNDLINVLSKRKIYTNNKGSSATSIDDITESYDDIFLQSVYEVLGDTGESSQYEANRQTWYEYYHNGNVNTRYQYNNTSNPITWWNRSPSNNSSGYFVYSCTEKVGSMYSLGFAPAFIVGKMNYDEVPSWSSATDAQIIEAITAHYNGEINLYDCWNIGDERLIHLNGNGINEDIKMVLVNCGGKMTTDNKECIFVVGQKDCLSELRRMNGNNISIWNGTELYTWLNGTYKNSFPDTIISIFKQHKNINNHCNYKSNTIGGGASSDYFSLYSHREINKQTINGDVRDYDYNSFFEYYKNTNNCIKKLGNDGSSSITYWTRTVFMSTYNDIDSAYLNDSHSDKITTSHGIAPFGVI